MKTILKKGLRKPLQVVLIQIMYLNLSDIFVLRLVQVQGLNEKFFRSGFFSWKKGTLYLVIYNKITWNSILNEKFSQQINRTRVNAPTTKHIFLNFKIRSEKCFSLFSKSQNILEYSEASLPSRVLLIQSWNMFKVNNKDTRTTPMSGVVMVSLLLTLNIFLTLF